MNADRLIIFLILLSACNFEMKAIKRYNAYFDDSTYQNFQNGIDAYQKGRYRLADSLYTSVINESKDNLSVSMPEDLNPYFYRGTNCIELGKYDQAISDMEHVASDTTTNTHVLLVRSEAFRMLKQYDTTISICNRLLAHKYDSLTILSQRGICYYQKGQFDKACSDLNLCVEKGGDTSFFNKFLKACKK